MLTTRACALLEWIRVACGSAETSHMLVVAEAARPGRRVVGCGQFGRATYKEVHLVRALFATLDMRAAYRIFLNSASRSR